MVLDAYFVIDGSLLFAFAMTMLLFRRYGRSTSQLYDDIDEIRRTSIRCNKSSTSVTAPIHKNVAPDALVSVEPAPSTARPPTHISTKRPPRTKPANPANKASGDENPTISVPRQVSARPDPTTLSEAIAEGPSRTMGERRLKSASQPVGSRPRVQSGRRPTTERVRRPDDGQGMLALSELILAPGFCVATEEEMTAVYNDSPSEFASRLHPVRVGWSNAESSSTSKEKGMRTFVRNNDGDYWMVFRSTDIRYVFPYPGVEFDDVACQHLSTAFQLTGHRPGYRYRNVKLVRPAIFSNHGLVRPGAVALEKGELGVDIG